MFDTDRDLAHEADLREELRARLEADFGGLSEAELLAEIGWEPEAPSWDEEDEECPPDWEDDWDD